jgi:hypothetical protein
VKFIVRLLLASSLLTSTAVVAAAGPAFAGDTIVVSCSNGFTRTVAAHAARGVATSLNRFNAHNHSGVKCEAAPGAPRPATRGVTFVTVTCTNGFTRRVPVRASAGITKALNKFNRFSHSGVTCALG